MQGPHRTILSYHYGELDAEGDCPQLEVGDVSCVPRPQDEVYIGNERYIVEKIIWCPDPNGLSITWVSANLDGPYPRSGTSKRKAKK